MSGILRRFQKCSKKVRKKEVFDTIPFELVVRNSPYNDENTCHRQSMC